MKIEKERDPYKMETTFAIKLTDDEMLDFPDWVFIENKYGVDSEEYNNYATLMDILSIKRERAHKKYLEEKEGRIKRNFEANRAINAAKEGIERMGFGGSKLGSELLETYKEMWNE